MQARFPGLRRRFLSGDQVKMDQASREARTKGQRLSPRLPETRQTADQSVSKTDFSPEFIFGHSPRRGDAEQRIQRNRDENDEERQFHRGKGIRMRDKEDICFRSLLKASININASGMIKNMDKKSRTAEISTHFTTGDSRISRLGTAVFAVSSCMAYPLPSCVFSRGEPLQSIDDE